MGGYIDRKGRYTCYKHTLESRGCTEVFDPAMKCADCVVKRHVWAYIRPDGSVSDVWYTKDPSELIYRNGGGAVIGPFSAMIPPPPTDMMPMFRRGMWLKDANGFETIYLDLL